MIRRHDLSFRFVILLFTVAFVSAQPAFAQQKTADRLPFEFEDGDSIVFLGDSITHQRLYTQYVEDFFYTRFPQVRLKFHNSGVGGAKAWDALQRFDRDVAAYKPKYVTVLLGMNDGRYQPYNEEIFQTYFKDMTTVIERIKAIGAQPILMTPTMFDGQVARGRKRWPEETCALYNSVLAYYGSWLRDVADESDFRFVNMYSPLNQLTRLQRKTDDDFTLVADAVHPGPPGQLVMAYAIIDDLGLRKPVSNIRVVRTPTGKYRVTAMGGEISDAQVTSSSVKFTFTANSLPWVVPPEADVGYQLLHLGHRASKEGLEVHGLDPGRYELKIDGTAVGTYSADALERHVELQQNIRTPQYRQALRVAELNKERNTGPVGLVRNEWRTFQQFARSRKELEDKPHDDALTKKVAELSKRLAGMEERIAGHEQAAQEIEDRIFNVNQPQARTYELIKVE
jgi:lysophospholipase L1-like esterase